MVASETAQFERINFKQIVPAAYRAMLALESYVHHCGLEASLLELVKCGRRRSTDAPSASTCTARMLARPVRVSSGCIF